MKKKHLSANASIINICQRLHQKAFVSAYGGNVSVRTGAKVVITPTRYSLAELEEDDLVVVDLDGNVLFGINAPSSELMMHLKIYQLRPDVCGIVHSHPPAATSFAYVNKEIVPIIPEANAYLKKVPIVPFHPVGSEALSEAVAKDTKNYDVVMLEKHGLVSIGETLSEAYNLTELVEETAIMNMYVRNLMREQ